MPSPRPQEIHIDDPADGAEMSALRFTAPAGAASSRTVRVFADACLASVGRADDAEELRLIVTELLADATARQTPLELEFTGAETGWRLRARGIGDLEGPIDPTLAVSRLDVLRALSTVTADADGLVIEPFAVQSSGP